MSTTTLIPPFEQDTYKKVVWRLIPFLFICYIVAFLDRVNVGFAKLQMAGDLKFSDTVYGFGAAFLHRLSSSSTATYRTRRRGCDCAQRDHVGIISWRSRSRTTIGAYSPRCSTTDQVHILFSALPARCGGGWLFPGIILYLTYWFPNQAREGRCAVHDCIRSTRSIADLEQDRNTWTASALAWLAVVVHAGRHPSVIGALCLCLPTAQGAVWLTEQEGNSCRMCARGGGEQEGPGTVPAWSTL